MEAVRILLNRGATSRVADPARFAVFDLQGCGPCAADLALPFRALDLADIGAFVSGFIGLDARSDLTGDGVWDLGDIQAFVASFNAGC